MPPSHLSLPTNRVFVVQFRTPPPGGLAYYAGRVEHLVSGEVARFHTLDELLAFMSRVLTAVPQDGQWGTLGGGSRL